VAPQEPLRLIAFSETHREWLPMGAIETLMAKRINFMDITDHQEVSTAALPSFAPIPDQPRHKPYVDTLLPFLNASYIEATIVALSALQTRYYTSQTGVQGAQVLYDSFANFASGRTDITVDKYAHTWVQPSIIATIPGRGPNQNEYVIIGGHEDSVGTSSTARAPGSDDDASGVSTLLEVFRVLVQNNYYPDRTVQFITYAGEEAGLLGSQAIATSYRNNNAVVHSVLQLDMTGYGSGEIGVIGDNVDRNLTDFVKILIDTYSTLGWADSACGYGCSDHASWFRSGYRAAFPFETTFDRYNPYIHTASDTLDRISVQRALEFAKVGLGYVIELADTTIPP